MASVDVIIPCYQHGEYLRDCVMSVLEQDVADLRVLIIDNASTDNSPEIARRLAADDRRIESVLRSENLGPHASFNEGVDRARADYLMILCSDDLLVPGSLARMVAVLERHPEVSFAFGRDVHWQAGEPPPDLDSGGDTAAWQIRDGTEFILERCRKPEGYIAAGMVLVRTAAHKAAGHYRPELPHTDDLEMLLRLALLGRVAQTSAVVGVKRMHPHNRTRAFLDERTRDLVERIAALESFFAREGRTLGDADGLLRLGRRSVAERAYWCGIKDLVRGRRSALGLLQLAFRYSPRCMVLPPFGYMRRMDRSLRESVRG
jgi:glycosyltransferase involved in cell wall biosynthesis